MKARDNHAEISAERPLQTSFRQWHLHRFFWGMMVSLLLVAPHAQVFAQGDTTSLSGKGETRAPTVVQTLRTKMTEQGTWSPVFLVEFDQPIDVASTLPLIRLRLKRAIRPLRLATQEEVDADEDIRVAAFRAPLGHWLAVRPLQPIPTNKPVTLTFDAGLLSKARSDKSPNPQHFRFESPPRFRVTQTCGWVETHAEIRFSHPIDMGTFNPAMIRAIPDTPGLEATVFENILRLTRSTRPSQAPPTIVIAGALRSELGQTLGQETRVHLKPEFRVPPRYYLQDLQYQADTTLPFTSESQVIPASNPRLTVFTWNRRPTQLELYSVRPEERAPFEAWAWRNREYEAQVPFPLLKRLTVRGGKHRALSESQVDLTPYLDSGVGHILVVSSPIEPPLFLSPLPLRWTWVHVTRIHLEVSSQAEETLVWATSLEDGSPLEGVEVRLMPKGTPGKDPSARSNVEVTDAEGLARLPSLESHGEILARRGADTVTLPVSQWYTSPAETRFYLMSDQQTYTPEQKATLGGWYRSLSPTRGDLELPTSSSPHPGYRAGPLSKDMPLSAPPEPWRQDGITPTPGGGLVLKFPGPHSVQLKHTESDLYKVLLGAPPPVQEVLRLHPTSNAVVRSEPATITLTARRDEHPAPYGSPPNTGLTEPEADAEVLWQVTVTEADYRPPHHPDFTFGEEPRVSPPPQMPHLFPKVQPVIPPTFFHGRTDASGRHALSLNTTPGSQLEPLSSGLLPSFRALNVGVEGRFIARNIYGHPEDKVPSDADYSASQSILLHPSSLYVGLRTVHRATLLGEPTQVELLVTDVEGREVDGREVRVMAIQEFSTAPSTGLPLEQPLSAACQARSSQQSTRCELTVNTPGTYHIVAEVADAQGRRSRSQVRTWVLDASAKTWTPEAGPSLLPEKQVYEPGDVARVFVQSPFYPAEGLLSVHKGQHTQVERFRLEHPAQVLSVPIDADSIPDMVLEVKLAGVSSQTVNDSGEGKADPRSGTIISGATTGQPAPVRQSHVAFTRLNVLPAARRLKVQVVPTLAVNTTGPGGEVDVLVSDAEGHPISGGEVMLLVADESGCNLSRENQKFSLSDLPLCPLLDPLSVFYEPRAPHPGRYLGPFGTVSSQWSRDNQVMPPATTALEDLIRDNRDPGCGLRGPFCDEPQSMLAMLIESLFSELRLREIERLAAELEEPPLRMWKRVVPQRRLGWSHFVFPIALDKNGRAQVPVAWPGEINRFRVMVAATDGGSRFGLGDVVLTRDASQEP